MAGDLAKQLFPACSAESLSPQGLGPSGWSSIDQEVGSSSFGAWMTFLFPSRFCSSDAIGLLWAVGSRRLLHTKNSQRGTHPHPRLEPRSDETGQR